MLSDRLTHYDVNGVAQITPGYCEAAATMQAIQRLAAYEDTGLEPEEILILQAKDPVRAAGGCYCRECVYYGNEELHPIGGECDWFKGLVDPGDFCSYGRKRDVKEET